jgi:hypothetical protein
MLNRHPERSEGPLIKKVASNRCDNRRGSEDMINACVICAEL